MPAKHDVARALMLRGSVFVHLDPRREGVIVPERFTEQAQLVLQIGLDLPVPIVDLRVDHEGVTGTLSFNRIPFLCFVPWQAVFALVGDDGRGMVFPDSLPAEIAQEIEHAQRPSVPPPKTKKTPVQSIVPSSAPSAARRAPADAKRASALRAVSSDDGSNRITPVVPAAPKKTAKSPNTKRELPPYLRVVK